MFRVINEQLYIYCAENTMQAPFKLIFFKIRCKMKFRTNKITKKIRLKYIYKIPELEQWFEEYYKKSSKLNAL